MCLFTSFPYTIFRILLDLRASPVYVGSMFHQRDYEHIGESSLWFKAGKMIQDLCLMTGPLSWTPNRGPSKGLFLLNNNGSSTLAQCPCRDLVVFRWRKSLKSSSHLARKLEHIWNGRYRCQQSRVESLLKLHSIPSSHQSPIIPGAPMSHKRRSLL